MVLGVLNYENDEIIAGVQLLKTNFNYLTSVFWLDKNGNTFVNFGNGCEVFDNYDNAIEGFNSLCEMIIIDIEDYYHDSQNISLVKPKH